MSIFQFADVNLRGNIGSIETKEAGGKTIKILSVAVNDSWKDQNGDVKSHTNWFKIAVFDQGKVKALEQVTPGQTVLVTGGKLYTGSYQKEDGTKVYTSEIRLFDSASRLLLEKPRTSVQESGSEEAA